MEVKVSVVIITYNHAEYIQEAIESILNQKTEFDFEFIISNDCSTDETDAIINKFIFGHEKGNMIRYFNHTHNLGMMANFTFALSKCLGKYIAFCDGDDYWIDPLKLQKQFILMESNPSLSACYHKIKWVFTYPTTVDPNLESNEGDKDIYTINDILDRGWFIRSCSMFFKNLKLPKDFETLIVGDYPLHVLLAFKGDIAFLNECMGVYRINNKGFSEMNLITDDFDKCKKKFLGTIYLNEYLDLQTQKKYTIKFKYRKNEEIYSYIRFIIDKHPRKLLSELFEIITKYNIKDLLFFISKKTIKKLLN